MKYYLKQAGIPLLYIILMAGTAAGILCIEGEYLTWLRILLLAANLVLYIVLVAVLAHKDGEDSIRVRVANDLERREIIRTGEDRQLKLNEEYKPWKGFFIGFITCIPLIILLLIHTILFYGVGPHMNGAGALAMYGYSMITGFLWAGEVVTILPWHYYLTLISVPILSCAFGFPYIVGAKKIERQQEMIRQKHRQIYGEDPQK